MFSKDTTPLHAPFLLFQLVHKRRTMFKAQTGLEPGIEDQTDSGVPFNLRPTHRCGHNQR